MKKLNVLFITSEFSITTQSGAGIYAAELVKSLSNNGVRVVVVTPSKTDRIEFINNNLTIYGLKEIEKPFLKIPSFYIHLFLSIKKIIQNEKIDIIHNNEYAGVTAFGYKPVITTIHHPAFKDFKNYAGINKIFNLNDQLAEKIVLSKSDSIISDSHLTQKLLSVNSNLVNKLHHVNVGVDTSAFRYNSKSNIRKINNISNNEIIFFMPGGARSKRKGSLLLFDALSKINHKFEYKCIISGDSREAGWKNTFNEGIIQYGLKSQIILPGEIAYSSLPDYYSAADIVLFPSIFEGFGIPTLEALSCEKPLIVTETGEAGHIVKSRQNAILIQPESSSELYSAIVELVVNINLRNKLAANARKSVVNTYDWNHIANRVIDLYKKL
jgi:glycosyltransferase involved in cell wall biosynthesis